MKKVLMIVLLLVGIGCAGGGYYIFYLKPQQDAAAQRETEIELPPSNMPTLPDKDKSLKTSTDYYVSPDKLGVREAPNKDAFIESIIYRGDKVFVLEKKDGWARISPYYVYEDGGPKVAEWVPLDSLLEVPPTITKEERQKTISSYIENSDDFKKHFELFIKTTDQLLKEKTCTPEDFEETQGWVKSTTFKNRSAYFVYCGGLKQANKIYLDVKNGEIFYR